MLLRDVLSVQQTRQRSFRFVLKIFEPEAIHTNYQCRLFLELEDAENVAAFRLDKHFQLRQIDGVVTDVMFAHSP